jgi:hypothetical protein
MRDEPKYLIATLAERANLEWSIVFKIIFWW